MSGYSKTLLVHRIYTESGKITGEESNSEQVEIRGFAPDVALAQVGYNASATLNLGNYESAKVGVNIVLPTYVEEIEAAYEKAKKFVESKLEKEMQELTPYRSR